MACKLDLDAADLERVLIAIGALTDAGKDRGYDIEVIAVRRTARRVEVRVSTSYRELTAAQFGSDYYTQYVAIHEATLTPKRVSQRVLFSHSTMYTEHEPHDDAAWAREIAESYVTF